MVSLVSEAGGGGLITPTPSLSLAHIRLALHRACFAGASDAAETEAQCLFPA